MSTYIPLFGQYADSLSANPIPVYFHSHLHRHFLRDSVGDDLECAIAVSDWCRDSQIGNNQRAFPQQFEVVLTEYKACDALDSDPGADSTM